MGETKKEDVNFVIVPTMTSREVVSLLLDRFPALRDVVCPDEESLKLATCVYDSFAAEVIKGVDDREFLESVIAFINDIAESTDRLLREVLVVDLLEGIAANPEVARKVSRVVGEEARRLLRDVEKNFYDRDNA
jgi:hypothetical protein